MLMYDLVNLISFALLHIKVHNLISLFSSGSWSSFIEELSSGVEHTPQKERQHTPSTKMDSAAAFWLP